MKNVQHKAKLFFAFSLFIAILWMGFSLIFNIPWIREISHYIPYPIAFLAVLAIAILPGFIYAFLVATLLLDKRKSPSTTIEDYPDLSILIAAYNEEEFIETTIERIFGSQYKGNVEVIVINDGSTDQTGDILYHLQKKHAPLRVFTHERNQGKAAALNLGLSKARYDYIVTVDGDTWLHPEALTEIVQPIFNSKHQLGAVAGSIIVENSKQNWLTKLQVWDYLISIAAVKRQQSLYDGTLVAQGAFSLYLKEAIQKTGGWLPVVGEDIVLTWGILKNNYVVDYAPTAIASTHVPVRYKDYFKQRKRWARGLFEAFRAHPNILLKYKGLSKFIIFLNLFFPLIDFCMIFILFPGILLALFFQFYLIAGLFTLLVLPLTLFLTVIVYRYQRKVFKKLNIPLDKNATWCAIFLLAYSFLQAPACLVGYIEELMSFKKRW